jgi:hypothetical protein
VLAQLLLPAVTHQHAPHCAARVGCGCVCLLGAGVRCVGYCTITLHCTGGCNLAAPPLPRAATAITCVVPERGRVCRPLEVSSAPVVARVVAHWQPARCLVLCLGMAGPTNYGPAHLSITHMCMHTCNTSCSTSAAFVLRPLFRGPASLVSCVCLCFGSTVRVASYHAPSTAYASASSELRCLALLFACTGSPTGLPALTALRPCA